MESTVVEEQSKSSICYLTFLPSLLPKQTFSLRCLVRWVAFWVAAKGINIEWWQHWCWTNLGEINNRSSSSTCHIYIISWWTVQPTAMNHVSYLIHRRVKEKKDSPNAEEVGRPMGSCTPKNSSMSESAVYDDQWKRWKLTYQYEIVHKAADIMCTCQYCGCNMCPMVARGGNINMV